MNRKAATARLLVSAGSSLFLVVSFLLIGGLGPILPANASPQFDRELVTVTITELNVPEGRNVRTIELPASDTKVQGALEGGGSVVIGNQRYSVETTTTTTTETTTTETTTTETTTTDTTTVVTTTPETATTTVAPVAVTTPPPVIAGVQVLPRAGEVPAAAAGMAGLGALLVAAGVWLRRSAR